MSASDYPGGMFLNVKQTCPHAHTMCKNIEAPILLKTCRFNVMNYETMMQRKAVYLGTLSQRWSLSKMLPLSIDQNSVGISRADK